MIARKYGKQSIFLFNNWEETANRINLGQKNGQFPTSIDHANGSFIGVLSASTGWSHLSQTTIWNASAQNLSRISNKGDIIVNLINNGQFWKVFSVNQTGIKKQIFSSFTKKNIDDLGEYLISAWKLGFDISNCSMAKGELNVIMSSNLNFSQEIKFDSELPRSYINTMFQEGKIITELIELTDFPGHPCLTVFSGNTGYQDQIILTNPEGAEIKKAFEQGFSISLSKIIYNTIIIVMIK